MSVGKTKSFEFKGRLFSSEDVELVREIVTTYSSFGRQELAQTIAELLEWERANGAPKWREARDLLDKLEADGLVELPGLRPQGRPRGSKTSTPVSGRGEQGQPIVGSVRDVAPVRLHLIQDKDDRMLWRELVERYHYLGHKVPFGAHLRYLISIRSPEETIAGCLQLSSPAWKVMPRDRWIGWSAETREKNLQMVVNNSRFLILPWIKVKNLASHVLSIMSTQFIGDWQSVYGITPSLLETFVDSSRFRGTCYRASNWKWLGTTQGRGRMDRQRKRVGAEPKEVFVYPLHRGARQRLCSGGQ